MHRYSSVVRATRETFRLPARASAATSGGCGPRRGTPRAAGAKIDPVCERVLFAHGVTSSAHGLHDVIGNAVAPDVAESSGKPPGDRAVPALEKAVQHFRSIADRRKRRARVSRIVLEESGRAGNQRCGEREQPQPILSSMSFSSGTAARTSNSEVP